MLKNSIIWIIIYGTIKGIKWEDKLGLEIILYQSITSVLSACITDDWDYISAEYETAGDKVDIAFLGGGANNY